MCKDCERKTLLRAETAGTVQKIVCNLAKAGSIFMVLKSTGRHCRCSSARLRFFTAEHSMIVSDETNRSLQFTIDETNSSLQFRIDETNSSLQFRIDETNRSLQFRIDETNRSLQYRILFLLVVTEASNWVWLSHFQPDPAAILPSTKCQPLRIAEIVSHLFPLIPCGSSFGKRVFFSSTFGKVGVGRHLERRGNEQELILFMFDEFLMGYKAVRHLSWPIGGELHAAQKKLPWPCQQGGVNWKYQLLPQ